MHFSKSLIASALLVFVAAQSEESLVSAAVEEPLVSAAIEEPSASAAVAEEPSASAALVAELEEPSPSGVVASETGASNASAADAAPTGITVEEAGMVTTHIIDVGGQNGSLTFSPENVQANVGELVQFQFHPKNHSVVQSTFENPCVPMAQAASNSSSAFYSGFMPTNASATAKSNILTYTIRVTDTKPIWFYCSQAKHCQNGMVGAINAATTGNKTMSAFKALAAQATENLSPGQSSSGGTNSPSAPGGEPPVDGGAGGAPTDPASAGAEQSANSASSLYDASRQSLFGLALCGIAALLML